LEDSMEDDLPLSVRRKRPVQASLEEEDQPVSKRKKSPEPDMEEEDLPLSKRRSMKRGNGGSQEVAGSLQHLLLPDEVWLTILQHLPPCSLLAAGATCRRLLHLAREPALWPALAVDWQAIKAQEEGQTKAVDLVIKRATRLRTLTINNRKYEQIKSSVVASVARRAGPSLRHLLLSPEVVVSNSAVAQLASLASLTSLELPGDWIKTAGAQAIASLTLLTSLKIPGAEQLTTSDLTTIVSSLPLLRTLDISDAKKGASDGVVVALARSAPLLEHLAMEECERVTGKGIKALAEGCPKLRHLALDGCYQVNDPAMVKVATACTALTFLSLGLCSTIKDTTLRALAQHCHHLQHLNLFGCAYISERGVARLVEALGPRSLTYLSIRGMLGLGQAASEKLARDWPSIEVVHTFLPKPVRDRAKKF